MQDQQPVIDFLGDPRTHGGADVQRVDTPISHVFLAGRHAYKLKRAVRTNFLDFSTASLRKQACDREIAVNAGAAAAIYDGVVPITRGPAGLHLGGDGPPVDWVVRMNRFDRSQEFDRLAERDELTVEMAERLADAVGAMHCGAPRTPEFGGAARVMATIEQIAEAIATSPQGRDLARPLEEWQGRARTACNATAARLDARRRHGYVRRCHGDLHLGNICIVDGRPTPFDALEFNEEMASTDILYDIAFTLMDLAERGLHDQANAFQNRYLGVTRDYSGLSLLPLFISMRAAVRCLVAANRDTPVAGEPTAAQRLDFALDTLSPAPSRRLIAVGGLSGSGKSTIARGLAPGLNGCAGAVVLRSDVIRKRLFGVPPEEPLSADGYRPGVSHRVYDQMNRDAARALRAGATAVLDATFLSVPQRCAARDVARQNDAPFTGLWLDCDPAELRRRISGRVGDASDADALVLEAQLARDPGPGDWTAVDASSGVGITLANAQDALNART